MRLGLRIPKADAKPFDVAGFGLNSIDLLAVVAEYPASNSKQRLQRFMHMPGGQIATALSACAKLGLRTSYIGSFGSDPLGAMSRNSLVDVGVDVSGSRVVDGATNQFAIIVVDARSGDRTVLWDRHPALTFDPQDVPRAAVTSGRLLIVDCHETAAATQAARYARDAGVPTVIDVEKVRPGIGELLQQIDVLIAAQDFPSALTGYEEIGRALEALATEYPSARLVCATLGEEGSLARCDGREIRTAAFNVDCVDSTGAGDAFRGAFAAGCLLMPDADVEDVLTYANAVAALNCRALGARGGLPTSVEVEELLCARARG
ncbi:MAG TPA: PfkB family carbohydrate kinase [Vicinamibacterales bacterium]|nr:PfkB family carbohydrate kinase [Vicinamibacterales bacterium]